MRGMPTATRPQPTSPARDRILATARSLFYAQGLRGVGVDLLIADSGVAKATFYKHFPSKDDLIVAYLGSMADERQAALAAGVDAAGSTPAQRLAAALDALPALQSAATYRGCAFINAAAEAPAGSAIQARVVEQRDWTLAWLTDLAMQAGASKPAELAAGLAVLMDGALAAGAVDPRDPAPVEAALDAGRRLVKRALKAPSKPAGKHKK